MNRDRIAGKRKQISGRLKAAWGRLTGNPHLVIIATRERDAGRFQERYGISKEQEALQFRDFIRRNRNWD